MSYFKEINENMIKTIMESVKNKGKKYINNYFSEMYPKCYLNILVMCCFLCSATVSIFPGIFKLVSIIPMIPFCWIMIWWNKNKTEIKNTIFTNAKETWTYWYEQALNANIDMQMFHVFFHNWKDALEDDFVIRVAIFIETAKNSNASKRKHYNNTKVPSSILKEAMRIFNFSTVEGLTQIQLKKQYHTLVKMYHPDANPNGNKTALETKFKEITKAYNILSKVAK